MAATGQAPGCGTGSASWVSRVRHRIPAHNTGLGILPAAQEVQEYPTAG